jgi:hypothetical protein
MPETFTPILLKWKASHLRRITQDERYVAEVEIRADSFGKRLIRALYRPFILTVREPIVMLFALYLTVVYIILFTFLDGYAYVFGETYGFSEGLVGLSFAGIGVGLCFASLLVVSLVFSVPFFQFREFCADFSYSSPSSTTGRVATLRNSAQRKVQMPG